MRYRNSPCRRSKIGHYVLHVFYIIIHQFSDSLTLFKPIKIDFEDVLSTFLFFYIPLFPFLSTVSDKYFHNVSQMSFFMICAVWCFNFYSIYHLCRLIT